MTISEAENNFINLYTRLPGNFFVRLNSLTAKLKTKCAILLKIFLSEIIMYPTFWEFVAVGV